MVVHSRASSNHSFAAPGPYAAAVQTLMPRLAAKLDTEAKGGTVVVSYRFPLPEMRKGSRTVLLQQSDDEICIYKVLGEKPPSKHT